jgi:hypothetical protein
MNKILINIVKLIAYVVYTPVLIIITAKIVLAVITAKKNGITTVKPGDMSFFNMALSMPFIKKHITQVNDGYTVVILPQYSMILNGIVMVTSNKYIFVGCEAAADFTDSTSVAHAVIAHEIGHVNHPEGTTTKRLWWNPEDWLSSDKIITTYTPAEIAADSWAIANGANPDDLIKFLKRFIWYKPLSISIRIYHIKRYVKQ